METLPESWATVPFTKQLRLHAEVAMVSMGSIFWTFSHGNYDAPVIVEGLHQANIIKMSENSKSHGVVGLLT